MGLFDNIFSKQPAATYHYQPYTDYEAWVGILYAVASVDGEVSDAERDALCRLLIFKNKFAEIELLPFFKNVITARSEIGNRALIDICAPLIKPEERSTVLALAVEIILSDGLLQSAEKELIEYIATALQIDQQLSEKIIEVMLIKNWDNRIFD